MLCTNCGLEVEPTCSHKSFCCDCFEVIIYLLYRHILQFPDCNINNFNNLMDTALEQFEIIYATKSIM